MLVLLQLRLITRRDINIKAKLYEENKCLFVLRNLRQEGFTDQDEIDRLFH